MCTTFPAYPRTVPNPPATPDAPHVTGAGIAWSLGALVCWTITPLLVEHLTGVFDLWASNGWRYGLAALMWLPLLILTIARGRFPAGLWKRALLPASFSIVAQVAFVGAFYMTGAAMVTFGLRFQIVATAIGAAMLFPAERVVIRRPVFLLGALAVMLGVIGVAAFAPGVFGAAADAEGSSHRDIFGVALAAIAGIGYAGYGMTVRKCLAGVSAQLSFSVISIYVGGAMLLLMVLLSEGPVAQLAAMDGQQWFIFILSVIFGLAAGHVIYFNAMATLGVAPATGVVQLQPLTVAAASYIFLKEVLTAPQIACGLVAVAGAGAMLYTQHVVTRRQKIDRMRTLDTLPLNEAVALEEAELAAADSMPNEDSR